MDAADAADENILPMTKYFLFTFMIRMPPIVVLFTFNDDLNVAINASITAQM